MISFNEEVQKKLDIYTKKNNQIYTKCLIRGIEIPINGRPEELVRQIFIHFLIKESRLFPNKINIKVEANNHDVEIHEKSKNVNFQPYKPPLIIAELKREDVNLKNHYTQIQRYLKKARCDIGILYNFHDLILFNCHENQFEINYLNSLNDIESIVFQSDKKVNNDIIEFEKAQNGNFDSFTYLVSKYGSRKLNRVVFKLKKNPEEIAGCFLRVQDDKVYYDLYDDKLLKKQQSFNTQDLEKLISIIY